MRASGERLNAEEFRAELDRRGLSQLEAARRMGVNDRTVRRWVLGERPIPPLVSKLLETIPDAPPPEPEPEPELEVGEPIDQGAADRLAAGIAAAEAAEAARAEAEAITPAEAEEPATPRRRRRKQADA